jgi:hypothetical protein
VLAVTIGVRAGASIVGRARAGGAVVLAVTVGGVLAADQRQRERCSCSWRGGKLAGLTRRVSPYIG